MPTISPNRWRTATLSTIIAGSLLTGGVAVVAQDSLSTPTSAEEDAVDSSERESPMEDAGHDDRDGGMTSDWGTALLTAELSPAEAVTAATAEVDGSVVGFGTGESDGTPVYLVQINDQLVSIDAETGDVLGMETVSQRGPGERSGRDQRAGEESAENAENDSEMSADAPESDVADDNTVTTPLVDATTSLESQLLTLTVSPAEAASIAAAETGEDPTMAELHLRGDVVA